MARSILLIRHAMPVPPVETMTVEEGNERALSSEGRIEAELLAERLSDEPVTAVFSSPTGVRSRPCNRSQRGVISIVRWSLGQEFTVDEALAEPMPSVFRFRDIDGTWLLDRL